MKVVPIDGEQTRAYLACERSHILRETGEFDEALLVAREAHRLAPNLPRHILELATATMASAGDYEEAIGCLQPLITSKACGQDVRAICDSALRYAERRDEYT